MPTKVKTAKAQLPTLDRCLKELQRITVAAAKAHEVWITASRFTQRNDNRFPFIGYLVGSSFAMLIVELYKLLDRRGDVLSFHALLTAVSNEGKQIERSKCDRMLEEMQPLWEKVRTLRVKYYAHLDSEKGIASLLTQTGNDAEVFEKLLAHYEKFLIYVCKAVGITPMRSLSEYQREIKAELVTAMQAIATKAGYPYF